jgi:transcriptional regulator with PAS, ATPase and Fis domain
MVDRDAHLVWISERYAKEIGVDSATAMGQPIESAIPNSLMRQVVVTGKPILLDIFHASGHNYVVIRMPIRNEAGEVEGAVAFALYSNLESMRPMFESYANLQADLATARRKLAEARRAKYTFSSFIGVSPPTMEVKRLARRAAVLEAPVLLQGETGTGKELLAHAIHAAGPRADRPFVTVNVAAIPETLLEAEFFGVAPGAFTGADRKPRPGKFELADGGSLFLDEIGDMPLALQVKLLRVLQDQEFEPLGSNRVIRVDVRILAATSRDLEAMVAEGRFRRDLFYRLNVLNISLPPLRDRLEDLELICEHLLERAGLKNACVSREVSPEAMNLLRRHTWPGNVRELRNVLERAMMNTDDQRLAASDFSGLIKLLPGPVNVPACGLTYEMAVAEAERRILESALQEANGKAVDAARRLGMSRATFYRKLNELQAGSHFRDKSQD